MKPTTAVETPQTTRQKVQKDLRRDHPSQALQPPETPWSPPPTTITTVLTQDLKPNQEQTTQRKVQDDPKRHHLSQAIEPHEPPPDPDPGTLRSEAHNPTQGKDATGNERGEETVSYLAKQPPGGLGRAANEDTPQTSRMEPSGDIANLTSTKSPLPHQVGIPKASMSPMNTVPTITP